MEISVHRANLKITSEYPSNSLSIIIELADGNELALYLADIEQWWALRNALPKAKGYWFSERGRNYNNPVDADRAAAEFYHANRIPLQAPSVEAVA